MAELLIKAKEPWNNEDVQAPSNRTRLGDIIVVKPDGWVWGKEEKLPNYVVIKLPGISIEIVKQYEESLEDATHEIVLKRRKFMVSPTLISNMVSFNQSVVTIQAENINNFMANIIVKVS